MINIQNMTIVRRILWRQDMKYVKPHSNDIRRSAIHRIIRGNTVPKG